MISALAPYLRRIGFEGTARPDVGTLDAMHWAHLQHVPFEALDIRPLKRTIRLDTPALVSKIVSHRRGGFCYELNGLLAEALEEIGFGVDRASAQFVREAGELSPPFDHLVLLVHVPGEEFRRLVDVGGASGSPARSLPLVPGFEASHAETRTDYRMTRLDHAWQMERRPWGEAWIPEYRFTQQPYRLQDFSSRCRYQETDPDSHFVKGLLCTRNIPGGRITISGERLIVTTEGARHERSIDGDHDLRSALREHFGIDLEFSEGEDARDDS